MCCSREGKRLQKRVLEPAPQTLKQYFGHSHQPKHKTTWWLLRHEEDTECILDVAVAGHPNVAAIEAIESPLAVDTDLISTEVAEAAKALQKATTEAQYHVAAGSAAAQAAEQFEKSTVVWASSNS